MIFKLDENLPIELAADLRCLGHQADTVYDEAIGGIQDESLMPLVKAEGRVLFTLDKGIADIRAYPPTDFAGLVLFRPPQQGRGEVLRFVRDHLAEVLAELTPGCLLVVSSAGIRRR